MLTGGKNPFKINLIYSVQGFILNDRPALRRIQVQEGKKGSSIKIFEG